LLETATLKTYNVSMPTIFRYKGFRFFFYSNEGEPIEPLHVHVVKGENVAKFWIDPEISVVESYGMKPHELNELCKVIKEKEKLIRTAWNEYFGS